MVAVVGSQRSFRENYVISSSIFWRLFAYVSENFTVIGHAGAGVWITANYGSVARGELHTVPKKEGERGYYPEVCNLKRSPTAFAFWDVVFTWRVEALPEKDFNNQRWEIPLQTHFPTENFFSLAYYDKVVSNLRQNLTNVVGHMRFLAIFRNEI